MARMLFNGAAKAWKELYPPLEPYGTGFLSVSPIHSIYYELAGNPRGAPVLFVYVIGSGDNNLSLIFPVFRHFNYPAYE